MFDTVTDDLDFDGKPSRDDRASRDSYASRPVPGIGMLTLGLVTPKPYPINIYNLDNDSSSGILGTLYPDNTFVALPSRQPGRISRAWNEGTKAFENHEVVWDGVVAGSIELSIDGPHRRTFDASVTGPWPINAPRPERLVNPEKARAAAQEAEESSRWN